MVIKTGDAPAVVHGTYAVHVHSPGGPATLENTHFVDVPASWTPVVKCENITNGGLVLELAGSVRLTGDAGAVASLVAINIGGTR